MMLSPRRTLAAALVTGAAGIAAATLPAAPVGAPPSDAVPSVAAAPGLCLDLSALGLASICIGSLL